MVEIENKSATDVEVADVSLGLVGNAFTCPIGMETIKVAIPAAAKTVVAFPLRRNPEIAATAETVVLSGSYETAGLSRPLFTRNLRIPPIPIESFEKHVAGGEIRNPYIVTGSIPFGRAENFHGRELLLTRVRGSVADQESREVLYINGIRRVGKTSLLNNLEGNPPSGTVPILIRVDLITPITRGQFWHSVARAIAQRLESRRRGIIDLVPNTPDAMQEFEAFPRIRFTNFMDAVDSALGDQKLFLMFDEFQIVTEAIRDARMGRGTDDLGTDVLDNLRGYLEMRRFLGLFTGSVLLEEIRQQVKGYDRLWGSLRGFDCGFVDADAVGRILRVPAQRQGVAYTDAAVDRVWLLTQGHPWLVQMLGVEIVDLLNGEDRLVVAPKDVERATERLLLEDGNFDDFWWDRKRLYPSVDGPIIAAILDGQASEWRGVTAPDITTRLGVDATVTDRVPQRLTKLIEFNLVVRDTDGEYRLRAPILERWLQRKRREDNALPLMVAPPRRNKRVQLLVDHENLWRTIHRDLKELVVDSTAFERETTIGSITNKLYTWAQGFGELTRPVAAAVWDVTDIRGHERVYRAQGFYPLIPIRTGPQAADDEIKQYVAENRADIDVYILVTSDGGFVTMSDGLLVSGKEIIWCAFRAFLPRALDSAKQLVLGGRPDIRVAYIEDMLGINGFLRA